MATTNKSEDEVADMNTCHNLVKKIVMEIRSESKSHTAAKDGCCAHCGRAKMEGTELTPHSCNYCDLNHWYCSVTCQQKHRETHELIYKSAMKMLQRNKILFKQPDSSHLGDCPICCLPIPFQGDLHTMFNCCCKIICTGCFLADFAPLGKVRSKHRCPFCRKILSRNEVNKNLLERIKADDSGAMVRSAELLAKRGDYSNSFKYLSKAAEIGCTNAHLQLAFMYERGEGVEKDEKKLIFHLEEAAIGGNPEARFRIGVNDFENKKYGESVKHLIIAANQGHDRALEMLKRIYKASEGLISKEDFAAALRAHHAVVCAMKSDNREKAIKLMQPQK